MTFNSPANSSSTARSEHGGNFSAAFLKPRGQTLMFGLVAGILLCGCHKKSEAQTPSEPTPRSGTASAPAASAEHRPTAQPLPASSQTIAANATAEEVAGQLTQELRRYIAYTRSIPKSFEDFAAHDPIKFPPPPAGKKFVISGGQIILK